MTSCAGTLSHYVASQANFTRSGDVNPNTGSLRSIGGIGHYWTSATYTNANNAYLLFFYSVDTYPSNDTVRWSGFSLRCITN